MFLLVVLSVICGAVGALKFQFMQKSIPRPDFIQRHPSEEHALHTLVFAIKQNNLPLLDEMLLERSTPGKALYQQWLSFDEITELTQNSVGTGEILSWLHSNDVNVTWTSRRQDYIKAEASIGKWQQLLNTQFYVFEDLSRTRTSSPSTTSTTGVHTTTTATTANPTQTNTRNSATNMHAHSMHRAHHYSVPTHLAAHLSAVFNTVQVPPVFSSKYQLLKESEQTFKTNLRVRRLDDTTETTTTNTNTHTTTTSAKNKLTAATNGKVTVSFLNTLYQISSNTGTTTQSQSVFETAEQSYSPNDLTLFQTAYNLPLQAALHPFGYNTTQCTGSVDCTEGNLDVQYMMGVAQQTATIYWYVTDTTTTDPFVGWVTDVADTVNPPLVNSMSWGSIEQANSEDVLIAFNTEALKLSAMGVTVVVSSGDNGAASGAAYCNTRSGSADYGFWTGTSWTGKGYFPSFPATSPYVTSVGATMGPESGNPEVACQSQLNGVITTGGGFSSYYPTPSWQTSAVAAYFANLTSSTTPTSGYNSKGRGVPDVSMIGVAYQVYLQAQLVSLYGTSAAAPVFAAMVSLANAARASVNKPSLGFLNPTLYAVGGSNGGKGLFNDVTSGNNKCMVYGTTCCSSGFYAAAGWDPLTGLGSITLPNLMQMFVNGSVSLAPTTQPTATPTRKPSVAPTPRPSRAPTVRPTARPSASPTTRPTLEPTELPSAEPTAAPTASPTAPSAVPTFGPTVAPSAGPTAVPSERPSESPTVAPSVVPTMSPSVEPSMQPSAEPSVAPTLYPTTLPTEAPTGPSQAPTSQPTAPSAAPTVSPTLSPTVSPSIEPSVVPSVAPTLAPSAGPSTQPSLVPSIASTVAPSPSPTAGPSVALSGAPNVAPTPRPSAIPSTPPTARPSSCPTTRLTPAPSVQPSLRPSTIFTPPGRPSRPTLQPITPPTDRPTAPPTTRPSAPTALPTTQPSRLPSARPSPRSVAPSAADTTPSAAPSAPPSPIVSFTCSITLTDLSSGVLSGAAQNALVQATAEAFQIGSGSVTYVDAGTATASFSAQSASSVASAVNVRTTYNTRQLSMTSSQLRPDRLHTSTTYTIDATTEVEVMLSDTTYSTTSSLYSGLNTLLQAAIASGNFTTILRAIASDLGASDLVYVTVASATSSTPVVTASATHSSGGSGLSSGEIGGIVIGCCAFFMIVVCSCMCVCCRASASVSSCCVADSTTTATPALVTVEVRSAESTLPEATVVRIENTYSQDEIPYPGSQDAYVVVVGSNPQLVEAL